MSCSSPFWEGEDMGMQSFRLMLLSSLPRTGLPEHFESYGEFRRHLDARKASFAPVDAVTAATGMEYGGITPVGLPGDWPVLVDEAVAKTGSVVIGSGIRGSKLRLPGPLLAALPAAQVLPGLGIPVAPPA